MNRNAFGQLLRALRTEVGLNRPDLADMIKISEVTLGKFERGSQMPRREFLPPLVQAFQLTNRERKEFFLAYTGVDSEQVARSARTPQDILTDILQDVAALRIPVLLLDNYLYILAASDTMLTLFGWTLQMLAGMFESSLLVYNLTAIRHSGNRKLYTPILDPAYTDAVRFRNIQLFRMATLRYRFTDTFAELRQALKDTLPYFQASWDDVRIREWDGDPEDYAQARLMTTRHETYGLIRYLPAFLTYVTPFGELYLITYVPASAETEEAFRALYDTSSPTLHRLASWRTN